MEQKQLVPGVSGSARCLVTAENTAAAMGSGDLPVFATPALAACMERAAAESVRPLLGEGQTTVGVQLSRKGEIMVLDDSQKSNSSMVYAGGDIVRGPSTVILAMGDGRRAAASMANAFDEAMSRIEI